MKKKILITGAGGYIGTELCNNLIKKNYNIIWCRYFLVWK